MEYQIYYSNHGDRDTAIVDIEDWRFHFEHGGIVVGSTILENLKDDHFYRIFEFVCEVLKDYTLRKELLEIYSSSGGVILSATEVKVPRLSECQSKKVIGQVPVLLSQEVLPLDDIDRRVLDCLYKTAQQTLYPRWGYVYLVRSVSGHYKIGHSKDLEDRLHTFKVKLPFEIELDHVIECNDRMAAEKELHRQFAAKRVNGSEFFALDEQDVDYIKSLATL